ncbi:hypothetical protein SLA2020_263960 [Shorea laevis]
MHPLATLAASQQASTCHKHSGHFEFAHAPYGHLAIAASKQACGAMISSHHQHITWAGQWHHVATACRHSAATRTNRGYKWLLSAATGNKAQASKAIQDLGHASTHTLATPAKSLCSTHLAKPTTCSTHRLILNSPTACPAHCHTPASQPLGACVQDPLNSSNAPSCNFGNITANFHVSQALRPF